MYIDSQQKAGFARLATTVHASKTYMNN